MAGDWIKMRTNLRTHPKVARIASALKADRLRVVGGLHAVWCLFDEHSVDGKLEGYSVETLDDELRWPGFSAALIAVQWLEEDGNSLCTPRFDEHNGQSAKRRCQEAERKRNERKSSASCADKKRIREEKRREDTEAKKPLGASAPGGTVLETDPERLEAIEATLQASLVEPTPVPKREQQVDADFERAWSLYPARHGGNPKKDAQHAWNARRREGVSADDMIAGVQRYAEHCKADGKIGTPYVMQAVRFFGTSKQYAEPWPTGQQQGNSKFQVAGLDHSSTVAAMERSRQQMGIDLSGPDDDDVSFDLPRRA